VRMAAATISAEPLVLQPDFVIWLARA
jgi:hypothetical protein